MSSNDGDFPVCEPHPAFTEQQQALLDGLGVDPWSLSDKSAERLADGLRNAEAGLRLSAGDVMAQEAFKGSGRVSASLEEGAAGSGVDVSVLGEGYQLQLRQSHASETGSGAYSLSFRDGDGATVAVAGDGRASAPEPSAVRQYTERTLDRDRDPEVVGRFEAKWMSAYKNQVEEQLREADLRTPEGGKLTVTDVYISSCADNVMAPPKYQDEHEIADHPRSPYDGRPMHVYDVRAKVTWTEKVHLPGLQGEAGGTIDVARSADIPVTSVVPETGEPVQGHRQVAGEAGLVNEGLGPIEWVMDAIDGAGLAKVAVKLVVREFAEKGAKEVLEEAPRLADDLAEGMGRGEAGARTPDQELDDFNAMVREETGAEPRAGEPVELLPYASRGKAGQVYNLPSSVQAAHGLPQGIGRAGGVPGYDPRAALTTLHDRATHSGMDRHWKEAFQQMRQEGRETASAQEVYETVAESIQRSDLPQGVKDSLQARLQDEMFVEFELGPDDVLPLPYPNRAPNAAAGAFAATAATSTHVGPSTPDPAGGTQPGFNMEEEAAEQSAEMGRETEPGQFRMDQDIDDSAPSGAPAAPPATGAGTAAESAPARDTSGSPANEESAEADSPGEESRGDSAGPGFNMEEDAGRQTREMEEEAEASEFRMDLHFGELPDGAGQGGEEAAEFTELPDQGQPAPNLEDSPGGEGPSQEEG